MILNCLIPLNRFKSDTISNITKKNVKIYVITTCRMYCWSQYRKEVNSTKGLPMQGFILNFCRLCALALFAIILAGCRGGGSLESVDSIPGDQAQEKLQSPEGLYSPQFPRESAEAEMGQNCA